jgi:hypothetical protein
MQSVKARPPSFDAEVKFAVGATERNDFAKTKCSIF